MRSRKRSTFNNQEETISSPYKKQYSKDGPTMGNFDPKYPESITAFADGLRSDVMEILGTSAGIINKSINFIFPFIGYETVETSENDSLHDIEVTNNHNNSNNNLNNNKLNKSKDSTQKIKQSQEALRMRCQSLWGKDSINNELSSSTSSTSQRNTQKGGKVLLDKLIKNPTIQV